MLSHYFNSFNKMGTKVAAGRLHLNIYILNKVNKIVSLQVSSLRNNKLGSVFCAMVNCMIRRASKMVKNLKGAWSTMADVCYETSQKKDSKHCILIVLLILCPIDLNDQMILDEYESLSMSLINELKSFGVIWDHLESYKLWGNKISCTINMQRLLSFFVGSRRQCGLLFAILQYCWINKNVTLMIIFSLCFSALFVMIFAKEDQFLSVTSTRKWHCN